MKALLLLGVLAGGVFAETVEAAVDDAVQRMDAEEYEERKAGSDDLMRLAKSDKRRVRQRMLELEPSVGTEPATRIRELLLELEWTKGATLSEEVGEDSRHARNLAYSPSGRQLMATRSLGEVETWDLEAATQSRHRKGGHAARWISEKEILVWQPGWAPKILEASSGETVRIFGAFTGPVPFVAWAQEARVLLMGDDLGRLRLFSEAGEELPAVGEDLVADFAVISSDGRKVTAWTNDHKIHRWTSGIEVETSNRDRCETLRAFIDGEGRLVQILNWSKTELLFWNGFRFAHLVHDGRTVTCAAVSPDQKAVACGTSNGNVLIFELPSGKKCREIEVAGKAITCLAFSPDSRSVAGASASGWIGFIDK